MSRAVRCTHPVPLHAHTHFLAAVRPALVLDRVRGQALAAALLLAGLRLAQDLGHALLVYIVQTLMDTHPQGGQLMPIQLICLKLFEPELVTRGRSGAADCDKRRFIQSNYYESCRYRPPAAWENCSWTTTRAQTERPSSSPSGLAESAGVRREPVSASCSLPIKNIFLYG